MDVLPTGLQVIPRTSLSQNPRIECIESIAESNGIQDSLEKEVWDSMYQAGRSNEKKVNFAPRSWDMVHGVYRDCS